MDPVDETQDDPVSGVGEDSSTDDDFVGFTNKFDPLFSPDWDAAGTPGPLCSARVKKDIICLKKDPLPGIFVAPEEDNLFKVHCLIVGPFDTPYEGGLFHFLVRFGPQYPLQPPRVRFMTAVRGHVRLNPNLYDCGKVCLSILGTWHGPSWSPASNLSSLLLSLQSILNEKPYFNEPGFATEVHPGDSDKYNLLVLHETIRVSVCDQLELPRQIPSQLFDVMKSSFHLFYDYYISTCEKNLKINGQVMENPFRRCDKSQKFNYTGLITRVKKLKSSIENVSPLRLEENNLPKSPSTDIPTENKPSGEIQDWILTENEFFSSDSENSEHE